MRTGYLFYGVSSCRVFLGWLSPTIYQTVSLSLSLSLSLPPSPISLSLLITTSFAALQIWEC